MTPVEWAKLARPQFTALAESLVSSEQYGFVRADRDDLVQEMMLDLLRRCRKYDPAKSSPSTFIARLGKHCVCTLIERQRAQCRDYRKNAGSLDVVGGARQLARRRHINPWPALYLCIDLREAIERLNAKLADLCDLLLAGETMTAVAKRQNICRKTAYDRLSKIRGAFFDAHLHEYASSHRREGKEEKEMPRIV